MFDAVLHLVEWAAAARPVLLVAEDVHRADSASLQLCAHIGRRLAARPVLFVLTRRDKPGRPDADALLADLAGRGVEVAELELGPLAAVELAAVARSVADLTDDAVDQVILAADGNPLLAVESARALAAGRAAPPQNLRAAVRAATGVLPRPARDLAEMLAAAGRELSAAELAAAYLNLALADRDAAEQRCWTPGWSSGSAAGCASGTRCSPRRSGPTWGTRGAATSSWRWPSRRPPRHPDRVAAEVAGHLDRAGRDDLAGPRWQRAARHARSLGAMPEAARFWAEAVRCDPEEAALRLELAEAFGWLGQDADFEREWQAALELLPHRTAVGGLVPPRPGATARWCATPGRRSPPTSGPPSYCLRTRRRRCGWKSCSAPPGASRRPAIRPAPPSCWTRWSRWSPSPMTGSWRIWPTPS